MQVKFLLTSTFLIISLFGQAQSTVYLNLGNPCSNIDIWEVDNPAILNTSDKTELISFLPNPSDGLISISIVGSQPIGPIEIQIFNLNGLLCYQNQFHSTFKECTIPINISNLPKALYVIGIETSNTLSYDRIITQ